MKHLSPTTPTPQEPADAEHTVEVNICDIQGPLRTVSASNTWLCHVLD